MRACVRACVRASVRAWTDEPFYGKSVMQLDVEVDAQKRNDVLMPQLHQHQQLFDEILHAFALLGTDEVHHGVDFFQRHSLRRSARSQTTTQCIEPTDLQTLDNM